MSLKSKPLEYLCTVYTSNPLGYEAAYLQAASTLGRLLKKGHRVFCPIAHCHTASAITGIPQEFDWWMDYDEGWIDKCDILTVVMMENWEESRGITHEIEYARGKGMPIRYIDPDTLEEFYTE